MTDSEKLDLILSDMQSMKTDMQDMKTDMQDMKTDMQNMKTDMQDMKTDMQDMKTDMQDMKTDMQNMKIEMQEVKSQIGTLEYKVTRVELHLENNTDKNVQLLAENFIELTNKLNQAIPAANKNLAYEVKVNYLVDEVEKLKKNVADLANKTA